MRNSVFFVGPYYNGIRPKRFLDHLCCYYRDKAMTSNGGKHYNVAFGK